MTAKVFITMYLDQRRPSKKTGLLPLRLRVKNAHITKFYATGLNFSSEYYEKITTGKRLQPKELNDKKTVEEIKLRATDILQDIGEFTFDKFERQYLHKAGKIDLYSYFEQYREELRKGGKFSTSEIYLNSQNALKSFYNKEKLPFEVVTPVFLKGFAAYLQSSNKSITTISLYIRCIRSLFNQAIASKDTREYPFYNSKTNPQGYKIPMPTKGKKAFSDTEVKKLLDYIPTESQQFWYDMFMFSYYAGGINIKDIALLKQTNVNGNTISFVRKKTEHSTPKEITVPLNERAKAILDRWNTGGKFVFPLLDENMDSEQVHKTIKFKTRNINKVMKLICNSLDIETPVSTYTARHTFASKLARSGAPIILISEALAHNNIKTTQNYLSSFPTEDKTKWFDML